MRGLKTTKRLQGAYFTLSYSLKDGSKAGFSCVVSKKTAAKAVERNLIKRRCRAAALPLVRTLPGGMYICTAKKGASIATYRDLAADIRSLLSKVA